MRISECAKLTDTTVRTIRHYHQVGLLEVPEEHGGQRDYGLDHVARILRIRWLAGAGLSLGAIGKLLESKPGATAIDDLQDTEELLTQQISQLRRQRQRVRELIDTAHSSGKLSPMSLTVEEFYARVIAKLEDPDAIALVRRELRLAELMAHRGFIPRPKQLDAIMATLDEDVVDRAVFFYTHFARLPKVDEAEAQELDAKLHGYLLRWSEENPQLTADTISLIPRWGRTKAGINAICGLLTLLSPHPRQAALLHRLTHELLAPKD